MSKYLSTGLFFTLVICCTHLAIAQGNLPENLDFTPKANELPGHTWSYVNGFEFEVLQFQNNKGNGVRIYLNAPQPNLSSSDYVNGIVMGQNVKLFKQCQQRNQCMYTAWANSGIKRNNNDLWIQLWIKPEGEGLGDYLGWLNSLQFIAK